ncbi:MAG: protease modulator HflK [Sedimentisphaerales bacterium]
MTDQSHENNKNLPGPSPQQQPGEQLDAAGKSLSEALRISFAILKVIMVVLVVIFLASGFRTVGSDEQAIVLRFGRIRGVGDERILRPGLHWVFPYPIDEIVRIPVLKKVNLPINSFWYSQTTRDLLGEGPKKSTRIPEQLNPVKEGYCITRSEKQDQVAGSDYNIVHCKWQLTYKIDDPERFFQNIYVDLANIQTGQNYADVISKEVAPLLEYMVADAVVTAMVNYTIDDCLFEQVARVTQHVKKLLQEKLDEIESGIKVVSMQLTDKTWPRQVDEAFQASIKASQESQKLISEARTYAENTLNEAAGPVAMQLYKALHDETISEEEKEFLWSQLAGAAQEKIAQARAYRTKVVESAKANVEYLREILPEYRKRPRLVTQKIYLDAIEYVLNHAAEKFVVQPTKGSKGREFRIILNRNPTIKPRSQEE